VDGPGLVRAVTAAESEQQAELVHLEQVGERPAVGARQQLLHVLVEPLAGHVVAEQLLLQRSARPLGQRRLPGVERRLVEQRDHREPRQPHVARVVAGGARVGVGAGEQLQHVGAEGRRVRDRLPVGAKPRDRGQRLLEGEGEAAGADRPRPVRRGRRVRRRRS
jgi:hypothetical protein